MAFTLTLPLIGLEPRNFSALSTRLQCEIIEYLPPFVFEQNSPNTTNVFNEGNGSNSNNEKSSQSKMSYSVESERRKEEKHQIIYGGRNVLNLGANIRDPMWKTVDMLSRGLESKLNRSIAQKMHEQTRTEDQTMKSCSDCRFRQPKPYLY